MTADLDATGRDLLAVATTDDETAADALRGVLHPDVVLRSPVGDQTGPDAVLDALAMTRGLFVTGTWSAPRAGEGQVEISATFPPGGFVAAAALIARADDAGRIVEITQRFTPAGPPEPVPLDLASFAPVVDGALGNGTTVVVAYVDDEGQPHLSFRGTVQVFDEERLALWARDAGGGLPRALPTNPRLAFWYHDPGTRTTLQFHGRGHVEHDPDVRDTVFERSPEREQQFDPERAGVAIVVDVDQVTGRGPRAR
jgi:Pyridoxamine 5'-phosphate oxidase